MKIQMFFLISFVLANNYCVGESQSSCQNICQNYETNFEAFFNKIPSNYEINTNNNTIHNIYIANNVAYHESKHNFIFCNPSIYLIYQDINSKITLKNHIYVDSNKMLKNVPILFKFNKNLEIEVETDDVYNIKPFALESTNYSKYPYLKIKFLTENFPDNLISISSNSYQIRIHDSTPYIKRILSNADQLKEDVKTYYCLSDKQIKCEKYNTIYNLREITSIDISYNNLDYPNYLIVDTSEPVIYYSDCRNTYSHIIAMPGSDITYYPNYQPKDGSYYVILHQDSIEMQNLYFEGEGNFTFVTQHNFSLASTTKINDIRFTIKSREPFYWHKSHIGALNNDLSIDMINKIKVPDFSMFYGPSSLQGLFETGKFIAEDAFFNVTGDTLKEYDYENITYYFQNGDHEIPKTWKVPCRFQGLEPSKTNFIFSDVYSYDGETIDNFIKVNEFPSNSYNMITIKPASYFYLNSFKDLLNPEFIEKYTIQVDNDVIMDGECHDKNMDIDEISHDQCRIIGSGTIFFTDRSFMDETKEFCKIDESIDLQYLNLGSQQDLYVCIGQNDIESCKSEIKYADTFTNVEWIWLRNMKTIETIEYHFNRNIKKVFLTDKCLFTKEYIKYDLTLTARSSLTIRYSNYSDYHLYNNNITFSGYGTRYICAQSNTAKLNIIFHYSYNSNSYYYNYINSYKEIFRVYYHDPPTNIDLQFYFNYENVKLYMIYYEDYVSESIKLTGKSKIYIREPYTSRVNIFKVPETITFPINPEYDYSQICYADNPVQSNDLYDFVLCSNYTSFREYARHTNPSAYIYKNISLVFNSDHYSCRYFYLNDSITVSIDLPNNASLSICGSYYTIVYDGDEFYSLTYSKNDIIIFDVKDYLTLNHVDYSTSYSNYFIPQTYFVSEKESLEIFPGFHLMTLLARKPDIMITVPENFSIFSPAPQYIKGLFGKCPIYYSTNWTYYHYSEEGKALYDSQESILFDSNQDDENLPQNIVLAVGSNDVLTLPSNWADIHNIFILQNINDKLDIDKPLNIYYHKYSVTLNEKFRIFVGSLNIKLTTNLTTMNASITSNIYIERLKYDVTLDFSENDLTDLYGGYIYLSRWNYQDVCRFYTNKATNSLTFHTNNQYDMSDWLALMNTNVNNFITRIDYDTICYNPDAYHFNKCDGDYYRITDFTTLLVAIKNYPELNISVPYDIDIPYSTGDYFKLDPYDESIVIELPYSPESMTVTENQILQFNYSDSSVYEILRKGKVKVNVKKPIKLHIESEIDADVTFILGSDVFVTSDSVYNGNMRISVENNYHHLYAEEIEKFGNIFGDALEPYIRMCAYDSDAISLCTFPRQKSTADVFTDPFECNEVEIALSSSTETSPKEIILPPILYPISVHILETSYASHMNLKIVSGISISSDSLVFNNYWNFDGEIQYISVIYIDSQSSISINDQIPMPITLQLTCNETIIDLKNCVKQNLPQITILKFGNEANQITVLGTKEAFDNFNASLFYHNDITVIWDGTQKYLCLCKDIDSCQRCKEGVDGLFDTKKNVINDPGEKVKIRVFSNIEVSSNVFTNYHSVYIDPNCMLNLTNTNTVNQNIESGLLVDKLHFVNGKNLILKPTDIAINIEMKTKEMGPNFTIEMDTFLRLNVTNNDDKNINSSRLHVDGHGELNCYDYPFGRIRPGPKVKVIKGVYVVCNSNAGHNFCSYESSVYSYKKLGNSPSFRPDFDPNSKILVFLDSFTSSLEVNLGDISHQKIEFVRHPFGSKRLLEGQNILRIISNNSAEITTCSNSTTSLSSSSGGTSIDNSDSDLFVFGVNENLTIKQEGDVLSNSSSITIHPLSEKVTIFIDDTVDIEKQKLKIESENENHVTINVVSNKNITNDDLLHKFIDADDSKVSINIGNQNGENDRLNKKGGLKTGAIIGIVIGTVVLVAVVIVIVIFVVRGKRSESYVLSDDNKELSDSTF